MCEIFYVEPFYLMNVYILCLGCFGSERGSCCNGSTSNPRADAFNSIGTFGKFNIDASPLTPVALPVMIGGVMVTWYLERCLIATKNTRSMLKLSWIQIILVLK